MKSFSLLLLSVVCLFPLEARDFHVTPTGLATNNGSRTRPWLLAKALSAVDEVKPGDTIWVHGGTYTGSVECRLKGSEQKNILVRPWPGEHVLFDVKGAESGGLMVNGDWTTFRDFEFTDSDPDRTHVRPHGVFTRGPHTKLINLVIHDCGLGIGFWAETEGPAEIYGCIIYNNGWQGAGTDRGHGHAIYTQNRVGIKRLTDNVLFNQFGYGIHAYGSSRAFLKGFEIEDNTSFNNGSLSRRRALTGNILVGGGAPAEGIRVLDNVTYFDSPAMSLRIGYGAANKDVVVKGNYVVGTALLRIWEKMSFTGNTVVASGPVIRLETKGGAAMEFGGNQYIGDAGKEPWFEVIENGAASQRSFAEWMEYASDNSQFQNGPPRGVKIFVRPNRYERGRAHVTVLNWEKADSVDVDLSMVLKRGDRFRVRRVQNLSGAPVFEAVYSGKPVRFPMTDRTVAAPIGIVPSPPVATCPLFDVFLVERRK